MFKRFLIGGLLLIPALGAFAQVKLKEGSWHAALHRNDGKVIPFNLQISQQQLYIINGVEKIRMNPAEVVNDSLIFRMPVFESYFKVKAIGKDSLSGAWVSGSESGEISIPLYGAAGGTRFPVNAATGAIPDVAGKWAITFTRANQTQRAAVGEFRQQGSAVTGTVLTPSGDYRYLTGVVSKDSLYLSTFDGSHAFLLSAAINEGGLSGGGFYSGGAGRETWTAVKDAQAALKPLEIGVKDGNNAPLSFTFKDIDGKTVSLSDEQFKGKPVILQIMGSWCPNCMDETKFLSAFYSKHKEIAIIALSYELSTNEARSIASLRKFQQQFNVEYTMLYTGATASDPDRTAKTLPQLNALKAFPTMVFLDREHKVKDISSGFYGPGAGEYHQQYKVHFEAMVKALLADK